MKPTIPPSASGGEASEIRLVVCIEGVASAYTLEGGAAYVIGRGSGCDIVIPDDAVSRRHALVYATPHPEIEDLGSKNGTSVTGQLLKPGERRALGNSAWVQIGPATLFVLSGSQATEH